MKKYTPKQIHYMENGCAISGGDRFHSCVVFALSKIPREIVDDALEECLFVLLEDLGIYLPKSINRTLLIFHPKLFELPEKEIEFHILHEVAHFHLKHKHPITEEEPLKVSAILSDEDYQKQEKEANELVEEWLSIKYEKDHTEELMNELREEYTKSSKKDQIKIHKKMMELYDISNKP